MTEDKRSELRTQVIEKYREAADLYAAAREFDRYVQRLNAEAVDD